MFHCDACVWYYQYMMAFVPSAMALTGMLGVISLSSMTIGNLQLFRSMSNTEQICEYSLALAGLPKQVLPEILLSFN